LTVQILPQALRKFQEHFPGVRVVLHDLSTDEMLAQLGENKLQVALKQLPVRLIKQHYKADMAFRKASGWTAIVQGVG
jgi:DNA-binding transcriptional LysR family regulator